MNKNDTQFARYSSYLLYLIPFFLIKFIFFADLFLILLSLIFLYLSIKYKKYNYFNNIYFKIFLFFYLLIIIRSLLSDNIFLSLSSSLFYIRFALFSLATIFFLDVNKKLVKILKIVFIIILLMLFFDTIFQYFFKKNILGFQYRYYNKDNFRLTSFFHDKGVLGSYVVRFLPFIIALFFFERKNKLKKIDLFFISLITLISIILVILSGERTSLLLSFICLLFIFLFSNGSLKKIFNYLSVISIVIVVFFITVDLRIKKRFINFTLDQIGFDNQPDERLYIFSSIYEAHFKIAYKMFKENPIFGKGVKMFRDFCSKPENFITEGGCTTHPHHTYVQILAETGLVGFVIIFFVFIFATISLFKIFYINNFSRNKLNLTLSNYYNAKICLLITIFITLFPFLPSGNFFNNWLSIIYFFPIGFLLYLDNINKFKK
jgi:O-antigen ligase